MRNKRWWWWWWWMMDDDDDNFCGLFYLLMCTSISCKVKSSHLQCINHWHSHERVGTCGHTLATAGLGICRNLDNFWGWLGVGPHIFKVNLNLWRLSSVLFNQYTTQKCIRQMQIISSFWGLCPDPTGTRPLEPAGGLGTPSVYNRLLYIFFVGLKSRIRRFCCIYTENGSYYLT